MAWSYPNLALCTCQASVWKQEGKFKTDGQGSQLEDQFLLPLHLGQTQQCNFLFWPAIGYNLSPTITNANGLYPVYDFF